MDIDETIKKPEQKTFNKETDTAIEKSSNLVKQDKSKLKEAVESLLSLEKQTRLGEDNESTARIVVHIVKLCAECDEWKFLNENILLISKKRGQSKIAIQRMVQEAMNYIDKTPSKETKVDLIQTLRTVTEGKIFVEVERARLTRALAKIKEEEGNKKDAAELLQEVQIETIGTMEAAEKIDFILESIRLCLDIGDYVRAFLISKKITTKSLLDIKHQDLKIRFYTLMIRYWSHKKSYLDIYRCYQSIYETPKIQESNEWPPILQNMILFVILSPYDNHQYDAMNRAFADKRIEDRSMIMYRELLRLFVSSDLIDWPEFQQRFKNDLSKTQVFIEDLSRWNELHDRIIEHNIRTIAKYYSKIHTKRLASLLHLEEQKAEDFVSKMVINKTIAAKIDRIEGVVAFTKPKDTTEILNNWSQDTEKLLSYVEKSVHLINKELAQMKKK